MGEREEKEAAFGFDGLRVGWAVGEVRVGSVLRRKLKLSRFKSV